MGWDARSALRGLVERRPLPFPKVNRIAPTISLSERAGLVASKPEETILPENTVGLGYEDPQQRTNLRPRVWHPPFRAKLNGRFPPGLRGVPTPMDRLKIA